jgi:hypothetical protein
MNEIINIHFLADCPEVISTLASWVFEQWGQQCRIESVRVQMELFAKNTPYENIRLL